MKRKLLCIILAASLILSVVMPATALAAKGKAFDDFEANGLVTGIDPGTVKSAGQSGRWIVSERQIEVYMWGNLNGLFTLTYKANVDSEQTGTFHGELVAGELVFKVRGKSELGTSTGGGTVMLPNPELPGEEIEVTVAFFPLSTTGKWTLIEGAQGNGDYDTDIDVVIALDGPYKGHIVDITGSNVLMTGKWKQ